MRYRDALRMNLSKTPDEDIDLRERMAEAKQLDFVFGKHRLIRGYARR